LLWGRFRVLAQLGAGGMGTVHRCEDTSLGEEVAVKLLPPGLASSPTARGRLKQEVKGARGLTHPNIVRVFEYYEPPGGAHGPVGYSMELLPGATLADHLSGKVDGSPFAGPPTLDRLPWVAALAAQLCAAVDHVHSAGLVHRDIKPSNIMLLETAAPAPGQLRIKLLDFGIVHTGLTSGLTGEFPPGTVEYMAPELLANQGEPGPAADIYSLGKVLYLALTGVLPAFGAESDEPSSVIPGLNGEIDRALLSNLASRPARRPDSAAALASAILAASRDVENTISDSTTPERGEREAQTSASEEGSPNQPVTSLRTRWAEDAKVYLGCFGLWAGAAAALALLHTAVNPPAGSAADFMADVLWKSLIGVIGLPIYLGIRALFRRG